MLALYFPKTAKVVLGEPGKESNPLLLHAMEACYRYNTTGPFTPKPIIKKFCGVCWKKLELILNKHHQSQFTAEARGESPSETTNSTWWSRWESNPQPPQCH